MVIYIAADNELPLVAWNEDNPRFHVTELGQYGQGVKKQFSKPFIYELGSNTSCCCGFQYGVEDEEEKIAAQEDLKSLSEYLANAVANGNTVEMYSCWNGDEEIKPEYRTVMSPSGFCSGSFRFEERQFIEIRSSYELKE
jgi:hypothetical protein